MRLYSLASLRASCYHRTQLRRDTIEQTHHRSLSRYCRAACVLLFRLCLKCDSAFPKHRGFFHELVDASALIHSVFREELARWSGQSRQREAACYLRMLVFLLQYERTRTLKRLRSHQSEQPALCFKQGTPIIPAIGSGTDTRAVDALICTHDHSKCTGTHGDQKRGKKEQSKTPDRPIRFLRIRSI